MPDDYLEEVYAVEDYTSTDEGGLSFSRGDRVYVLLRNRFGYCTGWSLFVADFSYLSQLCARAKAEARGR